MPLQLSSQCVGLAAAAIRELGCCYRCLGQGCLKSAGLLSAPMECATTFGDQNAPPFSQYRVEVKEGQLSDHAIRQLLAHADICSDQAWAISDLRQPSTGQGWPQELLLPSMEEANQRLGLRQVAGREPPL